VGCFHLIQFTSCIMWIYLHMWNKNLMMTHELFNVLLNLSCKYLFENFWVHVPQVNCSMISFLPCFVAVSLLGFGGTEIVASRINLVIFLGFLFYWIDWGTLELVLSCRSIEFNSESFWSWVLFVRWFFITASISL
jgi:hypothetical protein